ncbi:hypothetical protein GIB67_020766 [Kingdonia uniflora]|uniref:Uncharacterized protein n=1 Tax=Kingdonia uniflora TaxID=39325 RepID=A0A7J7M733_9MAGN|nr:hypothetical protein GIB67_020766 [Kingdonia uniflora]
MATKLALKSHPPPLTLFLRKPSLLTKPLPKLFSTISSSLTLTKDFPYGPSLHKGNKTPSQSPLIKSHKLKPESEECSVINKESFCRVFDIAAIRVPVEDCFALENCLRGHLLNWPRVRNIARVSGDEIDEQFKKLLPDNVVREEGFEALNRRIHGRADGDGDTLSSVLYRDKLVSSFNSRGYVKFRNLAKISRPKKKKDLKVGGEEFEGKKRIGKNDFVVVEVVGEDEDDMSGLLGGEFKRGGNWRGSTRLLLLDERFVNSSVEELPEAVKVCIRTSKSDA